MHIVLAIIISKLYSNNNVIALRNAKQEYFTWYHLIKNNIDLKSKNL